MPITLVLSNNGPEPASFSDGQLCVLCLGLAHRLFHLAAFLCAISLCEIEGLILRRAMSR